MKNRDANTPQEDALEEWAASDDREVRPNAVIWKGTPESRALMRAMLDAAMSPEQREAYANYRPERKWLNHPDDVAEARRRRALKKSGILGWLKVTLTRQRIPKRPPNTALDHSMNRTGNPEQVLTKAQWGLIAKHYGAEKL